MKLPQGQSLCQTIYQYLVAQIKLGYYKKGERLLTIHELCKRFHVSIGTAHKALLQLKANHYIELAKGTPAVVSWDFREAAAEKFDPAYYALRKDALLDLNHSLHLLFPSAWLFAFRLLRADNYAKLQLLEKQGDFFAYFYFLLQPLGNPLLSRLFYDIDDFVHFLYIRESQSNDPAIHRAKLQTALTDCLILGEKQDFAALRLRFEEIYEGSTESLEHWFSAHVPPAEEAQIPFQWQAYRGRFQQSYLLTTDIVHGILTGIYSAGQFLPSAAALAKQYEVSAVTVRHTIGVLNRLGITKTRNGQGTYVLPPKESAVTTALRSPDLRKKLLLYLYCLQILSLSCANVARNALPRASEAARGTVESAMLKDLHTGALFSTPGACLHLITAHAENAAVREVYRQLLSTLPWGYLLYFQPSHITEMEAWRDLVNRLLDSLRSQNAAAFAAALHTLVANLFYLSKHALRSIGIAEASQVADPPAAPDETTPL